MVLRLRGSQATKPAALPRDDQEQICRLSGQSSDVEPRENPLEFPFRLPTSSAFLESSRKFGRPGSRRAARRGPHASRSAPRAIQIAGRSRPKLFLRRSGLALLPNSSVDSENGAEEITIADRLHHQPQN